ncbi:hypothetical protein BDV96DRAFT_405700 [Lophiotrema nucula]|uniref:Zn(2)-C6 fungal-type domain-containing protein n=1 Tax=Lophiotrema nucula TaxID=690887 RepID=A0A6A5ZEI3_9PLEO|nr:hypothetical protein BDV96DRAFT_405700 [Lophiotrema nucula]
MATDEAVAPLSPDSRALLTVFTNLYEDESPPTSALQPSAGSQYENDISFHWTQHSSDPQGSLIQHNWQLGLDPHPSDVSQSAGQLAPQSHQRPDKVTRRRKEGPRRRKNAFKEAELPGFLCFASVLGILGMSSSRSRYSETRKEEVKLVRKIGACLRCQIRKISCSGESPCKECRSLAAARLGSKALMWMDCIRPSLEQVSIFNQTGSYEDVGRILYIMNDVFQHADEPRVRPPFSVNLDSASRSIAS